MNRQTNFPFIKTLFFIGAWCLFALSSASHAHSTDESILALTEKQGQISGEWSVPLKLLDMALDLDVHEDQAITWEEVLLAQPRIESYLKQAVSFEQTSNGSTTACKLDINQLMLQNLSDGLALFMPVSVSCPDVVSSATRPTLHYQLLFNEDPWHRGFISYKAADIEQNWIASPDQYSVDLGSEPLSAFALGIQFVVEGVWHIWIGLDHILFLIALLIPAVFCYRKQSGETSLKQTIHSRFAPMFTDTLKIVTAFTLSHSVTLGLAAFKVVTLPPVMIEIAIAASVVFSALLIWLPKWQRFRWQLAFTFGFIHGFGFANVLGDLTLPQESFALCLFAFNVGVELGQLAIVAIVLPAMFALRNLKAYTQVAIPSAMSMIALVGVFWVFERSAGL